MLRRPAPATARRAVTGEEHACSWSSSTRAIRPSPRCCRCCGSCDRTSTSTCSAASTARAGTRACASPPSSTTTTAASRSRAGGSSRPTVSIRKLYVDDLVTTADARSAGHGHVLLEHLRQHRGDQRLLGPRPRLRHPADRRPPLLLPGGSGHHVVPLPRAASSPSRRSRCTRSGSTRTSWPPTCWTTRLTGAAGGTRRLSRRPARVARAAARQPRNRAPQRSAAAATAASRKPLTSSAVSVRSAARHRSRKASDRSPGPIRS